MIEKQNVTRIIIFSSWRDIECDFRDTDAEYINTVAKVNVYAELETTLNDRYVLVFTNLSFVCLQPQQQQQQLRFFSILYYTISVNSKF